MFIWDSFGYHLYLPATMIHQDPFLKEIDRVEKLRQEHAASGTLYQVSTLPDGRRVIKYPMGLAVIWGPWFMVGDLIADATGQTQDGYSTPYDLAVRTGVLIYLLLGLLALRSALRRVFDEWTTALTLFFLFAATNLLDQAALGLAMPHLPLFCLYAGVLWATLRWTEERRLERAVILAILMGLATLVRPSEILCLIIPFLWHSKEEPGSPILRAWRLRKQWLVIAAVMFLIGLPQFLYWKAATGHWFLDTYNNPGEGFDLLSPHTWPFLFGFRKGWFIYTPLMLVATAGFFALRDQWRVAFVPIGVFFLATVYLLSSWTCWWYADSFGSRAMVGSYALLALPLAAVIGWARKGDRSRRMGVHVLLIACTVLNLFQYWQFKKGLIHSSRMTWPAYAAVFGSVETPEGFDDMLLVERSYSNVQEIPDSTRYSRVVLPGSAWELSEPDTSILDSVTRILRKAHRLSGDRQFTPAIRIPFETLSNKDHVWVEVEWQILTHATSAGVSLVTTMEHKGESYGYGSRNMETNEIDADVWTTVRTFYLTPHIRSTNDPFVTYFWLRDTVLVHVHGPTIAIHERLERN